MRLVFLGTPAFAVPTLERILAAGHEVLAVYTQPDRPKGRGGELAASPVKRPRFPGPCRAPAGAHQAPGVSGAPGVALRPDAMVVVGYGQIIPQSIIDIPPLGIINVHASLLPKYRGAAPVQWALARGEIRHRRHHHANRRRPRHRRHPAGARDSHRCRRRPPSNSVRAWRSWARICSSKRSTGCAAGAIAPREAGRRAGDPRPDPPQGRRPDRLEPARSGGLQ